MRVDITTQANVQCLYYLHGIYGHHGNDLAITSNYDLFSERVK